MHNGKRHVEIFSIGGMGRILLLGEKQRLLITILMRYRPIDCSHITGDIPRMCQQALSDRLSERGGGGDVLAERVLRNSLIK